MSMIHLHTSFHHSFYQTLIEDCCSALLTLCPCHGCQHFFIWTTGRMDHGNCWRCTSTSQYCTYSMIMIMVIQWYAADDCFVKGMITNCWRCNGTVRSRWSWSWSWLSNENTVRVDKGICTVASFLDIAWYCLLWYKSLNIIMNDMALVHTCV